MTRPRWLSPAGLAIHAVAGLALTVLLARLGESPPAIFLTVLVVGLAHEHAERDEAGSYWGDFRLRQADGGGPLNGVLDVAAFLVAPVAWWAAS